MQNKATKTITIAIIAVLILGLTFSFPLNANKQSYKDLNEQGITFSRTGNFEKTVEFLEKAIAAYESEPQKEETKGEYFVMRSNLGVAYIRLGQKEKGDEIIEKASTEFKEFMENLKKRATK